MYSEKLSFLSASLAAQSLTERFVARHLAGCLSSVEIPWKGRNRIPESPEPQPGPFRPLVSAAAPARPNSSSLCSLILDYKNNKSVTEASNSVNSFRVFSHVMFNSFVLGLLSPSLGGEGENPNLGFSAGASLRGLGQAAKCCS